MRLFRSMFYLELHNKLNNILDTKLYLEIGHKDCVRLHEQLYVRIMTELHDQLRIQLSVQLEKELIV